MTTTIHDTTTFSLGGTTPIRRLGYGAMQLTGEGVWGVPVNMIQAQRDYFGAHGYERIDRDRGDDFHTDWTGDGAEVPMESYNA